MNNYFFDTLCYSKAYDFENKEDCIKIKVNQMLLETNQMFEYNNLPKTIKKDILELMLQSNGCVFFTNENPTGDFYVYTGGLGGEPDAYYRPTIYTVANPYQKFSKNFDIKNDGVLIKNDSIIMGLLPLLYKYATLLVENELSLKMVTINTRASSAISATDDKTYKSALKFLKDIESGKLGVIMSNEFLEGIKAQPLFGQGHSNNITQLLELEQYLKSNLYTDIGLRANYNMKRESLNSAETSMNDTTLLPLVENMLMCRKNAIDEINSKYGLNIEVNLSSAWEIQKEEIEKNINLEESVESGQEVNENV